MLTGLRCLKLTIHLSVIRTAVEEYTGSTLPTVVHLVVVYPDVIATLRGNDTCLWSEGNTSFALCNVSCFEVSIDSLGIDVSGRTPPHKDERLVALFV